MSTLFLDANVIIRGLVSRWGLNKAVLSLCAARVHRLMLAEYVRHETENALLEITVGAPQRIADQLLSDYDELLRLTRPLVIPLPSVSQSLAAAHQIRHVNDVPVLASALSARPDWLLSNNTKHFDSRVAARTGLQIATPFQFFQIIHRNA